MSEELYGLESRSKIEIEYSKVWTGCLELYIYFPSRDREDLISHRTSRMMVKIVIPTKELVLAIKRVEEERDVLREKSELHSKEPRLPGHEELLKAFVYRTADELREVLRDPRYYDLHRETIDTEIRDLKRASTLEEAISIYYRIKETHIGAVSKEIWDITFDYVEDKEKFASWTRIIREDSWSSDPRGGTTEF